MGGESVLLLWVMPEKGPFLGIFGQKTPKKGLKRFFDQKIFKNFSGRFKITYGLIYHLCLIWAVIKIANVEQRQN